MKKFLLEFGRDFLFIDEEYHVQVGKIDKSILQRKLAELYDMAEEEVKKSQQD